VTRIAGEGTPASVWSTCPKLAARPYIRPAALVPPQNRAVVVAPHPDDEVLGSGGLLAHFSRLGRTMLIIAVTDGTASHPGSPTWTCQRLARIRPAESQNALRRLGIGHVPIVRAGFADGAVGRQEAHLTAFLERHLRHTDVVFATWRDDGHPDHEAVGLACAQATSATGARLIEVPIWAWHWARPGQIPWRRAIKVELGPEIFALKRHAVAAYASQIEPDAATGAPPILPPYVLARLLRPYEVLLL
jgi:LmbE family N-acetylglucosaminyl deacetylase